MVDFRCVFVVYTGLCLKYHMDSRNTNFKVSYSASFFFSEALSWDSQVWQLWMKTRLFVEQVSRHYTSDVFVWTRSAMLVCFLQGKHLVSLGMFFEKKKAMRNENIIVQSSPKEQAQLPSCPVFQHRPQRSEKGHCFLERVFLCTNGHA